MIRNPNTDILLKASLTSIASTFGVHISSTTLGIRTREGSTPYRCMSRVHSLRFSASRLKSNSFS